MRSVDVRGVSLSYGQTPVLVDLDLTVPSGAVLAVLGRSGCGKTSLLRALAGLVRPQAGSIHIGGTEVFGPHTWVKPEDRHIGLVPQEGALFPHLDVAANVGFGLAGSADEKRARVAELLELVGMAGTESMRPFELSGGMQQRVAVARALSRRPQLVLLDEPFSALDAGLRDDVRSDVLAAIRADGATALLVTHDQDEALSAADRVAIMAHGRIVQEGTPWEVYLRPVDLETARFVGEALEIPGVVTSGEDVTVDGPLGRLNARTPGSDPLPEGTAGTLVIRPEDLAVEHDASGEAPHLARGTVTQVRYHGHDCLIGIALDAGPEVTVRTLGLTSLRAGQRCRIHVTRTPLFLPAS